MADPCWRSSRVYEPQPGLSGNAPPQRPSLRVPVAWIALCLGLFTLGGVLFGLVFVRNVRVLAEQGVDVGAAIQEQLPPELGSEISRPITQIGSRVRDQVESHPILPSIRPPSLPPVLPAWSG